MSEFPRTEQASSRGVGGWGCVEDGAPFVESRSSCVPFLGVGAELVVTVPTGGEMRSHICRAREAVQEAGEGA